MANNSSKPEVKISSAPEATWPSSVLRGALAFLLLWAALSKLANPTAFLGALYAYELPFPRGFSKLVAVVLPWVELLCGLLLLGRLWLQAVLTLIGGMFAVFIVATGQAWARGLKISCGCFDFSIFGISPAQAAWLKILETPGFAVFRNLALLAATVFLLRRMAATNLSSETPGSDARFRR